jgi:hypothetical protein
MTFSSVTQGSAAALPTTGRALPQYDPAGTARETAAKTFMRDLCLPHPKQSAIMERIEALRLSTLGVRGVSLPGLRLSQVSQAGKTKTLERYMSDLRARTQAHGGRLNPHQVVYLGLKRRITVKMLYQRLLTTLGDPHPDKGNLEILVQRAEEFLLKSGVELLIVDEVQHLANSRADSNQVTDELKSFLDQGLVPVVFAGNEDSRGFFEENIQLTARLGAPLELTPTDVSEAAEARMFKTFCKQLDEAIANSGVVARAAGFEHKEILGALLTASSGHIGRVCRIVGAALEHAARRDAEFIETYDLAYAVDHLAVPARWTARNPFASNFS